MDKEEIEKIVRNMLEKRYVKDAVVNFTEKEEFHNDFADEVVHVEIIGVPADTKLSNKKWHESNGYTIEFNLSNPENSNKARYLECRVIKGNEKLYLCMSIPY